MDDAAAATDDAYGDRCDRCGRVDVDDRWLWLEVQRPAEDDCEFESVDLAFCCREHAGAFFLESEIDWQGTPGDRTSGVRADRYFLGCGLLAIVLSVIGVIAVVRFFV